MAKKKPLNISPDELAATGTQLGNFGDALEGTGNAITRTGDNVAQHAKRDKHFGGPIGRFLGKAMKSIGTVVGQGARNVRKMGDGVTATGKEHHRTDQDNAHTFDNIPTHSAPPKPHTSSAGAGTSNSHAGPSGTTDKPTPPPTPHGTDGPTGSHSPETPEPHLPRRPPDPKEPHPELTPDERTALDDRLNSHEQNHKQDFDNLSKDPDKGGGTNPGSKDEARVGLDLRENGRLPHDLQRPPQPGLGDLYSPSTGKYYDMKGVHSDWPPLSTQRDKTIPYRGGYDPSNNQKFTDNMARQVASGRDIILDTRNANQAAIEDLRKTVDTKGWGDRVVWYP